MVLDTLDVGRYRTTDGLWTHKGKADLATSRITYNLSGDYKIGRGMELLFDTTASPGNALIQSYDRDNSAWCDLYLKARNINLGTNAGGKVTLPAGTATKYHGAYRQALDWTIPAAFQWTESPVQFTATVGGGMMRFDACGSVKGTTSVGQGVYLGLGMDGTLQIDSINVFTTPIANAVMGYGFTVYLNPTATSHRFALFVYGNTGCGLSNVGPQTLHVSEQFA